MSAWSVCGCGVRPGPSGEVRGGGTTRPATSSCRFQARVLGPLALVAAVGVACSSAALPAGDRLAFPGARGFGVRTPAGRGGRVIRVTNLEASGRGSFREALEATGPRTVVFEVAGVIDLKKSSLRIGDPFVTVAGETAPSPGVTVIRGGIAVRTHDVVIRHVRVRPGDAGERKKSGWEPDGISTSGADAYNIVIDHCSVTWAVDENISASGPRHDGREATSRNVTISNCIVAEGLNDSSHAKGRHSKGSLIHDYCTNIAVIGNLYAHNVDRNPYFKAHTTGVVVNNLIYNPGRRAVKVDYSEKEWTGQKVRPKNARIAVVGNVLLHGRDTPKGLALVTGKGDVYLEDNVARIRRDGGAEGEARLTSGSIKKLDEKPVWPEGLEALPASEVFEHVLANAGARPADRDSIDRRIVAQVRERKGEIIDSQDEVGGYPEVKPAARRLRVTSRNVEAWIARFAAEVERVRDDQKP